MKSQSILKFIFRLLILISLISLYKTYHSPMWWVSLEAPNYPKSQFPDGIRIHFHVNGVFNGCKMIESDEIYEDEALDCVEEMNTINHFIGMEPISAGAKLEFKLAPYIFSIIAVFLYIGLFFKGPFWWVFFIPVIILPIGFVADMIYWLWWFGHNLHPWGAFTFKPFMPTALGDGKVAQFVTHSYPHIGFAYMSISSFCTFIALFIRRKIIRVSKECTKEN